MHSAPPQEYAVHLTQLLQFLTLIKKTPNNTIADYTLKLNRPRAGNHRH